MKKAVWHELWIKGPCPYCDQINWSYGGNPDSDGTDPDPPLKIVCWSCKETFRIAGSEEDDEMLSDPDDTVDGLKASDL
jgi:hypothetical protein